MTDNKFVEEDYERLPYLDRMYLQEREHELFEEWIKWQEEETILEDLERKAAHIEVIMPEVEKEND